MLFNQIANWNPHLYLPLVVFLFSIVQSLLGVGLLLFGTPTLMLLGMNFGDTLAILLPCSVAVNLCQLRKGLPKSRAVLFRMMRITLPMLFLGLLVVLGGLNVRWMPILVGAALIGLGVLRVWRSAASWLNRLVTHYQRLYMAVMGLVHGVSNMGGGLLVVFASAVSKDKEEIRKTVALGYLMFALTQLITLAIFHPAYYMRNIFIYLQYRY
jgi:hypothetical protein